MTKQEQPTEEEAEEYINQLMDSLLGLSPEEIQKTLAEATKKYNRERYRKWYEENKEHQKAAIKKWRKENKDKVKEYDKKKYEKRKARIAELKEKQKLDTQNDNKSEED